MKRFVIVRVALAGLILLPNIAVAQVRPPASTQPGQVEQHLQLQQERPDVGGSPVITLPDEYGHKKSLKTGVKFVLKGIKIENSTAFTQEQLSKEYEQYIGKESTIDTLNEIASRITARYRNAGYILSRAIVPPQTLDNGVATIRIIEGYVNQVRFEGLPVEKGLLAEYAAKIRSSKPLDAKALERYLLLMEDLPGITARAVIVPAKDAPGASDIVITLESKTLDGSATLDNRGTRYLGPVQAGLTANLNNIFGIYDRTQFHGVMTAEENELRYGQITHEEQLDSEGTKLSLSAGYTRTHPDYTLAAADLEGWDKLFSAMISHPFIRTRQSNLYGNIEFDVHDTNVDTVGTELYDDKLRVLRAGGSYDFVDRFSGVNKFETALSQGFNWGTNESVNSITGLSDESRQNGRPDFFKGTFQASRLQPITGPFDFYAATSGQWSANALLTAEQFGIGGATFGSAFDPSEITGDSGADGRVELRYNRSGDFAWIPTEQLYTFYDLGKVWNHDLVPGGYSSTSLADTGVGLRFNAEKDLSGSLEFADPLTHGVAADGKSDYRPRVFFSLAYRY